MFDVQKNVKRVTVKPEKNREIFKIFHEIFQGKKFHEILQTTKMHYFMAKLLKEILGRGTAFFPYHTPFGASLRTLLLTSMSKKIVGP